MNGVGILESMAGPLQNLVRNYRLGTVYVTNFKGIDPESQILLEKIRGTAAEAKKAKNHLQKTQGEALDSMTIIAEL